MSEYQIPMFSRKIMINGGADITDFVIENIGTLIPGQKRSIFQGSIFEELRNGNPHQRGAIGEKVVIMLADRLGMSAEINHKYGDVLINGIHAEVKTAFEGENGIFVINQIRPQDYKYLILIAFRPDLVQIFTIDKKHILNISEGQHGGNGSQETKMYRNKNYDALKSDLHEYAGIENFKRAFKR